MKKTQRSFAVEYKSGRRKKDPEPKSIWGSLDLKSVARDVERSTMPLLQVSVTDHKSHMEASPPKANRVLPILTLPAAASEVVVDTQETPMADDADAIANTDVIPNTDAPAADDAKTAPRKQRKPRARKASPDMTASDTQARLDGGNGQKKRTRKPKALGEAVAAKRGPAKRARKNEQPVKAEAASAGDEMADLLQLEEENQKLRKLLAEKLRAENADLRKKLKLG